MWVFVIGLASGGDWIGLVATPAAIWSGSRATAQVLRGKVLG
jgi:hypothetical protein